FRVVEDDPHDRVDQVGGDLLRSTRRHRQHADNDVLVAHDVLPESSGAFRGLTKTSAVKPANCFRTNSDEERAERMARHARLSAIFPPLAAPPWHGPVGS